MRCIILQLHDPVWVRAPDNGSRPAGAPSHFAHAVVPAEWVPECPVLRVEEPAGRDRATQAVRVDLVLFAIIVLISIFGA